MSDMIAAQATPAGRSALAVIRISGGGAHSLVEKIMHLTNGRLSGMRRAVGPLYGGEGIVDSVVALSWPEGRSYTGEEMVEIVCHGVPSVTREILALLADNGVREPGPGEFTRRALLSGTMDGVDVIALSAMCDGKRCVPAGTFRGKLLDVLDGTREAREELEGRIEFGDSHGEGMSREGLARMFREQSERLSAISVMARAMDVRSRVFVMGPPNTGKSTLFNVLTGRENAVVSDTPGTTRDGRSVEVEIDGRDILLFDTAGSGGTGLDGEAGRITASMLEEPDRIVWLSGDGAEGPDPEIVRVVSDVLVVQPKSDIHGRTGFRISSVTGEGLEALRGWIASSPGELSLSGLAASAETMAGEALENLEAGDESMAAELLSEVERRLASVLGEDGEAAMCVERALSRLCVGK
jgi:tRNA modification GTPase